MRVRCAVAELADAVMCGLNEFVLSLHELAGLQVDITLGQSLAIGPERGLFSSHAFREDGVRFSRIDRRLQSHPCAMDLAAHGPTVLGSPT